MTQTPTRLMTALLAAGLAGALLAGCGSDSSDSSGSSAGAGGSDKPAAAAEKRGEDVNAPCDLTDQQTVASVFPGASAGKPGNIRNCEFTFSQGKINIFLFEGLTLDAYKKQVQEQDMKPVDVEVGSDGAFRDSLHTIAVGKGDYTFGVQVLPSSGVQEKDLAKYDPQSLALAKKIYAGL